MSERKPTERKPLFHREKILASDIAEVIGEAISDGSFGAKAPIALTKRQVSEGLVRKSLINDSGVLIYPGVMAATLLYEKIMQELQDSYVFHYGYKKYEQESGYPVAPVNQYFFDHIYAGGATRDCLDAMSDDDISASLPRRTGYLRNASGEVATDETGQDIFIAGNAAGIVVFPSGTAHTSRLLIAWHAVQAARAKGRNEHAADRMERLLPESPAVSNAMRLHSEAMSMCVEKGLTGQADTIQLTVSPAQIAEDEAQGIARAKKAIAKRRNSGGTR